MSSCRINSSNDSDFLVQIYSMFRFFFARNNFGFYSKTASKKRLRPLGNERREEIFEKSSRTRHVVACPVREVESARSGQTSIVNPQTLSETAFFRKMPRVFAEGTRVA